MNLQGLLEDLLKSGGDLVNQGRDVVESKVGVPEEGPERSAMLSGLGKGALAGGLLALLLGTGGGRRIAGSALKLGSLAAVGGIAYKMYKNWQQGQAGQTGQESASAQAADRVETWPPSAPEAAEERSRSMLKAMIAAAKADGHIDDRERDKIETEISRIELDDELQQFLRAEISKPLDPADVAAGVQTGEAAAEIYVASLMVIDTQNYRERTYLDELAQALRLDPTLTAELENEVRAAGR